MAFHIFQCVFYQFVGLPILESQKGHRDVCGRFEDYISNTSNDGKSVHVVDTTSGSLSFEVEKRLAARPRSAA